LVRIKEIGDIYKPGTLRERGYMRSISSIWNTDSMGSDADLSGVLMADLEPEAKASSVSSASPVPGGGDGDSEAGRYPEIILVMRLIHRTVNTRQRHSGSVGRIELISYIIIINSNSEVKHDLIPCTNYYWWARRFDVSDIVNLSGEFKAR
jgi:hypothetical protein